VVAAATTAAVAATAGNREFPDFSSLKKARW